jgi:hypothetical protein
VHQYANPVSTDVAARALQLGQIVSDCGLTDGGFFFRRMRDPARTRVTFDSSFQGEFEIVIMATPTGKMRCVESRTIVG